MSNKLETLVKEHREEFDALKPSEDLWKKIDTGMHNPPLMTSKLSWLKWFAFGMSIIVVLVYLSMGEENSSIQKMIAIKPIRQQAIISQEKVVISEKEPSKTRTTVSSIKLKNEKVDYLQKQNTQSAPIIAEENKFLISKKENSINHPLEITPSKTENYYSVRKGGINSLKVDTSFSGIKTLEIHSSCFDVSIESNKGDQISFKTDMTSISKGIVFGKDNYKTIYERKDSTLIVTVICESKKRIILGSSVIKDAVLNFDVPRTTNIIVNCSYGNIKAIGLQGKTCYIQNQSGDINIESISANVKLESGYGNIFATNIKGSIVAQAQSGDISINGFFGNTNIKTSYGNQILKNLTGNLKSNNVSGNVKITGMKGDVEITAGYGTIILENYTGKPVINAKSGNIIGRNIMLTEDMTVTTSYGNITMNLINDMNDLSFDLETTYGNISIEKGTQKTKEANRVVINKGKILVKGYSNSGSQFYR